MLFYHRGIGPLATGSVPFDSRFLGPPRIRGHVEPAPPSRLPRVPSGTGAASSGQDARLRDFLCHQRPLDGRRGGYRH